MKICFQCNKRAFQICECSALICPEHANAHLRERNGHGIVLIKAFVISDTQQIPAKSLIPQLKKKFQLKSSWKKALSAKNWEKLSFQILKK